MSDVAPVAQQENLFTIADALALPVLCEGVPEVLAGASQLGRPIRWVHCGEFPDMPAVLKGGELLLTHGMSVSSRESLQRRYVADLSRAGLAGLIIELGPGMQHVGGAMVAEAHRCELPLIVLHHAIPWIEVTEAVHRTIVHHQASLLERGQELHERFAALVAAGAGVAEVLRALADSVGNPVLLGRDGELVSTGPREHAHLTIASAWEASVRALPHAPDALSMPVAVGEDPHWGIACVLALERPLNRLDRIALAQAVPLLALALLRANELDTLAARERGEFLEALVDPDAPFDDQHAHRLAARIGLAMRTSWLLPLVADLAPGYGRLDQRRWALVGRDVRTELASRQIPAVVGTLANGQLALIAGVTAPERRDDTARMLADAVQRAIRGTLADARSVICVGALSASWSDMRLTLRETIEAVPAVRHAPPQPWHDVSRPDLRRLLWALRGQRPLVDFVERQLAALRAHDARGRSDLLHTLEAFCATGGRKTETARMLHIERQSLYKRLARIEALLDADLTQEDTRLGLHLALYAQRLLGGRWPNWDGVAARDDRRLPGDGRPAVKRLD
ncbi:PucR family transcriptional regulator [Capillimicrobium parvum]|uniref:PucR family transcriptional regulator n=1 Tax=Capillimicrobium parvum TaxID=2884022 RepID=A0A9E6XZ00_9ACTN|nr:PucR family transcriptional regulator [Capillimicrobium parvum]UGS37055.1 hypothetical protein DSM104329_03467 [Capillimicrobium parvum]